MSTVTDVRPVYSRPYDPTRLSYYTAVTLMLSFFIIFIVIADILDKRPPDYVSKYSNDCLLQMSTTYSGEGCV